MSVKSTKDTAKEPAGPQVNPPAADAGLAPDAIPGWNSFLLGGQGSGIGALPPPGGPLGPGPSLFGPPAFAPFSAPSPLMCLPGPAGSGPAVTGPTLGPGPAVTGPALGPAASGPAAPAVTGPTLGPAAPAVAGPGTAPAVAAPAVGPAAAAPQAAPDPEMVRNSAKALFDAMDGWGTNEANIMSTLRGRSPSEIAAIRAEFQNHYGHNLDQWLRDELGGDELAEAQALMNANRVESTLVGLTNSLGFWNDDEAQIERLMRDLSPEELTQIQADPRWAGVRDRVRGSLGGADLEVFDALGTGDRATASAIRVDDAVSGWGTDEDAVYANLGNLPPDQRAQVEAAFNARRAARGDSDLRTALRDDLSGPDLDRAVAVLDNDTAGEGAARIQQTMDGLGTNEAELFRLLEDPNLTPEQRQARRAAYETRYGSLATALGDDLSGTDLERANMGAENGRLDPAFALFHAMEGVGTDEALIRDTIRTMTPQQIQDLRSSWNSGPYRERYGASFDDALGGELSGRDEFDIVEIGLRGQPQTPEEMRTIAEMQYQYERGDRAGIFGPALMDFAGAIGFSSTAEQMDRQHDRMNALYDAQGNFTGTDAQLRELYGWSQQDMESYRAAKDSATDAIVTGVELAAGTLATIATSGAAAPWLAATIGGLVGTASGMLVRRGIQGEAYGAEAIGADALRGALTAGLAGAADSAVLASRLNDLARTFGPQASQQLVASILKSGFTGMTGGMVEGAMNEDALRAGLGDWLASVGGGGLRGLGTGLVSGGVGEVTKGRLGEALDQGSLRNRLVTNGVSGALGELSSTAVTPGTFTGTDEQIWGRLGRSVLKGGGNGMLAGEVERVRNDRNTVRIQRSDDTPEGIRYRQELVLEELVRLESQGVNVDGAMAYSDPSQIRDLERATDQLRRQAGAR